MVWSASIMTSWGFDVQVPSRRKLGTGRPRWSPSDMLEGGRQGLMDYKDVWVTTSRREDARDGRREGSRAQRLVYS